MKKLLLLLILITITQTSFGVETANIRMNISGATYDNRYFLCMPDIGCLSILAANHGKIYPIMHSFTVEGMFLSNVDNFKVYPIPLPPSCRTSVETNQTLIIRGHIVTGPLGAAYVSQLNCRIQ